MLSVYAQRVSSRLRAQHQVASQVGVWVATGWADTGSPRNSAQIAVPLPTPSDDPIAFTKAADRILPQLFPESLPGVRYARASVTLTGLTPASRVQPLALFQPEFEGREVGKTLDQITKRLGGEAIGVGFGGLKQPAAGWEMKRAILSPRATMHWDELVTVRAGAAGLLCGARFNRPSICSNRVRCVVCRKCWPRPRDADLPKCR